MGHAEYKRRLALRIGVYGRRLDVGGVLQQPFEDVDRLPDSARDEVAEQSDIGVRDVVVGDTTEASIADRVLSQQAVLGSYLVPSAAAELPLPQTFGRSQRW